MKRLIFALLGCGFFFASSTQEIVKTKWQGIGVQSFTSTSSIRQFTVSGPDVSGYVYLKAHSGTGSGDIIRTKWQGTAVQEFTPNRSMVGFETTGPDFEGYVTLTAVANNGSKKDIFRSKWQGTAVQDFSAPPGTVVNGFTVSGPDASGWVTLTAVTGPAGVDEKFETGDRLPSVFALNSIAPNPGYGPTEISYSLAKSSKVSLAVFDCTGRSVKKILQGEQKAGNYHCVWLGTDNLGRRAGAGIYFVKMEAGDFKAVKKLVKW